MEFDGSQLALRRAFCVAGDLWQDRTIRDDFDRCVKNGPDRLALTAVRVEPQEVRRFTYRELDDLVRRAANGLARRGVGPKDVVSIQLPNWWQFSVLVLACARLGAVANPLMPIFRERELGFMLAHGGAKVLVVPKVFRGFDHEEMALRLRADLSALKDVVIVGGEGPASFDNLLAEGHEGQSPHQDPGRPRPDDVAQLIYTSGTTGEPKGVMHSANTLRAALLAFSERLRLTAADAVFMASPLAHQTGFQYGILLPVMLQGRAVLLDTWEPKRAVAVIHSEAATFTMASTPFLMDLAQAAQDAALDLPTLKTFVCAGAPIPGPLVQRAGDALAAKIVSAWGMTETGAVTTTRLEDRDNCSVNTDGLPLKGSEVRVVDGDGAVVPTGEEGRLLVRGASCFGGYFRRREWNNTDADGWFDTGDLARMNAAGYIRISGRSKDVIIRGGENIPVVEIEALLCRHPAVLQVAIVAYPDARLGERACAVVVLRQGHHLELADVAAFLGAERVTKQYMPERLVILTELPSTPSGKVQKFRLREMIRNTDV
jgi:cyclohexanecarboxylate-CoA ligase